jgi:hypothetical protein
VPKKEELIDIEQSYIYIPINSIENLERLYGFYTINGENKYVYLVEEKLYNKISNNNYILADNFILETKLEDITNNNYYDQNQIDLNSIYYYCNYNQINNYIFSDILDNKYVKADLIKTEVPKLDDEGNLIYDEEGNIITEIQEIDMGYRLYNKDTDSELLQKDIYFLYNDSYIPLSFIEKDNSEKFVEYVLLNNSESLIFLIKNNLQEAYFINDQKISKSEYNEAINNLYYKVADKDNQVYYISQSDFSNNKFIYYYSTTSINGYNYFNKMQLNLMAKYKFDEEDKIYVQDNENGTFYQTFFFNPNVENSEYIPITENSNSSAHLNKNNIYISNRLYPTNN